MRPAVSLLVFALTLSLILVEPLSAGVNRWTSEGPFGGRIDGMAADAFDPDLVYAATLEDLYRSVDGGETWSRVLTDRGTLVEVETSPHRSGEAYFVSFHEGIFRTTDRGVSSTRILGCLVNDLAFDPNDPDMLLAATLEPGLEDKPECGGLLLSPDGGKTWSRLSEPEFFVAALAIDPMNPEVVYAASNPGIYRSTDGGETFSPTGADFGGVNELLFDPADSGRILVRAVGGIYASSDEGATWNLLLPSGDLPLYDLAAHRSPARLWAAGEAIGLRASANGGATWQEKTGGLFGTPRSIALDPSDSDRPFVGTDVGVFRTPDEGLTWRAKHTGIDAVRVHDVLPGDQVTLPGRPLLLATSVGVLRDGLEVPEDLVEKLPVGVDRLAAGRIAPSLVYAASPTRLWRSEDSGATWTEIRETVASLRFDVFSGDPTTLLLGSLRRFEVSFDAGESWAAVAVPEFQFFGGVEIGSSSPLVPRAWAILDGLLFGSGNLVDFTQSESQPPGFLLDLAADPYRPGSLFTETSEGWFRSLDSGATWEGAGAGLPGPDEPGVFTPNPTLAFHPGDPDLLYAATNDGVLASIDGGDTWASLGSELRGILVHDVEIDPQDGNRLLAGTEHGLFTFDRVADLSLRDGRFRVEVGWKNFEGLRGAGLVATVHEESTDEPVPLRTRDSTIFRFFRPENWEAQLKVLDGRAINDHFWVFFSAATNVGYELRVTDTVCGGTQTYGKTEGPPAPAVTHGEAFPACPGAGSSPSCDPAPGVVCLGPGDRFRAELEWSFEGEGGQAFQVTIPEAGLARSEDSGVFHFFGPGNWEMLVKVLDGCPVNDRFWVFAAASTDVEYTLRVTDTVAETTRTYENPLGRRAPAINDIDAFPGCDL